MERHADLFFSPADIARFAKGRVILGQPRSDDTIEATSKNKLSLVSPFHNNNKLGEGGGDAAPTPTRPLVARILPTAIQYQQIREEYERRELHRRNRGEGASCVTSLPYVYDESKSTQELLQKQKDEDNATRYTEKQQQEEEEEGEEEKAKSNTLQPRSSSTAGRKKISDIINKELSDDDDDDGESEVDVDGGDVSSLKIDASNVAHETTTKPLHKPISIGRRKISDIINKELSDNEESDENDESDDDALLGSNEILISDINGRSSEALAPRAQQTKSSSFKGKMSIAKKNWYGLYSAENSEENEGNSEESSEGGMSNDLLAPSASDVVAKRSREQELSCTDEITKRDELISTSDEDENCGLAKGHGMKGKKRKLTHGKGKGRVSLERRGSRQSYHEHGSSEEEEKDSDEDGGNSSDDAMSSDELISSDEEEGHGSKLGASTANAISSKSQQSQGNTLITSSDAIGSSINKSLPEDDSGWHSRRSESEVVLSRIRRKQQRSLLKSRRRIRTNAHATVNSPDTPNNNRIAGGNGEGVQQQQLRRTTLRFAAAPVAVNKRKKQMTLKSLFKKG